MGASIVLVCVREKRSETRPVGEGVTMGAATEIEHVVVLMLENRSFDCMLGRLYPKSAAFEGLSGAESNLFHRPDGTAQTVPVWNDTGMDATTACIPDPDPGELFPDMNAQLFGQGGVASDGPPPMSGFVDDYMSQAPGTPDPRAVMHYFTPEQVPVISALARAFGLSDQWHASAPCQTWPNRFFAHAGTCAGYVDNDHFPLPFKQPTIFRRLQDAGKSWHVYFHDVPQVTTIEDLWVEAPLHFKLYEEFPKDAASGSLPNYSFIEPRYFTDGPLGLVPNDEHPPHNVAYGEQLIASVYNAVRAAPTWKKTLFIITYDEHGGCYDHMPPPAAVSPDALRPDGFAFDRYGVRVPAVIVSPWVPPGSIVRSAPAGLPHDGPPYPFDHTSIIKTLRALFGLGNPLTARDAAAPDLLSALTLDEPTNDGPASVTPTAAQPSAAEVATRAAAPPNSMQSALCRLAGQLPGAQGGAAASDGTPQTTAGAHAFTMARITSFLSSLA